jgi:hypothetical protein
MNADQERIAFMNELGEALQRWAYVENVLIRIIGQCVGNSDRDALAVAFLSIENFRSKLMYCDRLVSAHCKGKPKQLEKWQALAKRVSAMSVKRNKLVHHLAVMYQWGKPGRRLALEPALDVAKGKPTPLRRPSDARPPPGALFLRDIAAIRLEINALVISLVNFLAPMHGGSARGPFPEALEQPSAPMTAPQLVAQIRATLEGQPTPSRKSPRKGP